MSKKEWQKDTKQTKIIKEKHIICLFKEQYNTFPILWTSKLANVTFMHQLIILTQLHLKGLKDYQYESNLPIDLFFTTKSIIEDTPVS
jgi:hypothetical protein